MPAPDVPALVLRRLPRASAARRSIGSTSRSPQANSMLCSARTAPERRRLYAWSRGSCRPTQARSAIFGVDARRSPIEAKQIVAWLPDEPMLYDKLDPLEYLEFVAGLWSVEARRAKRLAEELLESLGSLAASPRSLRRIFARHAAEAGARRRAHP